MDTAGLAAVYQFDGFALDLVRGALLDPNGAELPLRAKSFDLLRLFVANPGRLLARDTINKAIWPDLHVTDDAVTHCVRDIRRALGDDRQRTIKTMPRRGYIFTVKVTRAGELGERTLPANNVLATSDRPTIAVLPFSNMSGDPDQQYFSDGVTDDIITDLSRSRSLFVIARNSSFTLKKHAIDIREAARQLGVSYLLEGSVRRSGSWVRVTAQLIDAESGKYIWAERYNRQVTEVFSAQDEITAAIVQPILAVVSNFEQQRALRKPGATLTAWETYELGLWHMGRGNRVDNAKAQNFFDQASDSDPSLAAAHSAAAMAIFLHGIYGDSAQRRDPFRAAAKRARHALEIDPADADAHAILVLQQFSIEGVEQGSFALSTLSCCLMRNPDAAWVNGIKGMILVQLGRYSEGRAALHAATQLNPRNATAAV